MRKSVRERLCYIAGTACILGFIVKTIFNFYNYDPLTTSFPFWATLLVNTLIFLVPAVFFIILEIFIERQERRKILNDPNEKA